MKGSKGKGAVTAQERRRIQICNLLRNLRAAGAMYAKLTPETLALLSACHSRNRAETAGGGGTSVGYGSKSAGMEASSPSVTEKMGLAGLEVACSKCTLCGLSQSRLRVVFGHGPQRSDIVVVGEWPGRKEEESGRPFEGGGGEMLTKMLRAIGIERDHTYLTYGVKCRVSLRKERLEDKVAICSRWLKEQLMLIAPRFILCFGDVAVQAVLNAQGEGGKRATVAELRAKIHGIRLSAGSNHMEADMVVTYSPSFLLALSGAKQIEYKRLAWHDLQLFERHLRRLRHSPTTPSKGERKGQGA